MLEVVQAVVGFALFLGAGYALSRVLFPSADIVERGAASISLAFAVPMIVFLFLALVLRLRVDALFAWVLAIVVIAGSLGFERWSKNKSGSAA